MNWSPGPRRARRRWVPVALAVAILHLLLLMWWQQALRGPPSRPAAVRPPVLVWLRRVLPPPAPQPEITETPPARVEAPLRRGPAPATAETEVPPQPAAAAAASAAEPASEAAGAAAAAASAPAGSLLDTEASRHAIREAARQRSTGELGASATGEKAPLSEPDRIGQEIARGARGDCLKGEYAGSGMGLLSLPFWLIAELREKCRR